MQIQRNGTSLIVHLSFAISMILALCTLPAAASESAAAGRVFLTFDDGPINITLDLLDELKRQQVKATFFINAIHLDGRGGENEDRAKEALRRIVAEGHVLGNHSYDHMGHNRAAGVYASTAASAYRDVGTDLPYFIPMNIAPVNDALGELAARPNNQIDTLARLPFANVWAFPNMSSVCTWCGASNSTFWHPDARARADLEVSEAGGQLAEVLQKRYKIDSFGWDIQWMPANWTSPASNETLPPAAKIEREIVALLDDGRHCVQPPQGESCKLPLRSKNVVILAHDFLFENGSRGRGKDINMPQLIKLIEVLKARGYIFETMDHYLD